MVELMTSILTVLIVGVIAVFVILMAVNVVLVRKLRSSIPQHVPIPDSERAPTRARPWPGS